MVNTFENVPARDRVIVALDCGIDEAFDLADQLQGKATWVKVGMTLFYANGPAIVYALKERGFKVFLDLKFHDIPHQVEGAAYAAAGSGADMLTMHTVGGVDMMAAAQRGAERAAAEYGHEVPATLGITVLTSMNDAALAETGVSRAMSDQVVVLAEQAKRSGISGVVAGRGAVQHQRHGRARHAHGLGDIGHGDRALAGPARGFSGGAGVVAHRRSQVGMNVTA